MTTETPAPPADSTTLPVPLDLPTAERMVADAAHVWAREARARVPDFVDRHYTLVGSARLHRAALGADIARAPVNVALGAATAGARLSGVLAKAVGARQAGDWLARRSWFLETDVGRDILFRLHDELLMLPGEVGGRRVTRDALFDALLAEPEMRQRLAATLQAVGARLDDPNLRRRLTETLSAYVGSRSAASDLAGALTMAAAGFAAYNQLTPGLLSLASPLSASLAHGLAVSGFWAGPWAGGLWYGMVGAPAAGPLLTGSVALGLAAPMAVVAAFSGVVTDPVQRRLGLHQRRLRRTIDTLERQIAGDDRVHLAVRDHYVARVFDVWDITAACWRAVTPM